jgi:hypothetical protein
MTWLFGTLPADPEAAATGVATALALAKKSHWKPAVDHLEAAARVAPPELIPAITETLATFYVACNRFEQLAKLASGTTQLSPLIALGCLLIERVHRRGGAVTVPSPQTLQLAEQAFFGFLEQGRYDVSQLGLIAYLFVDKAQTDVATQVLERILDYCASTSTPPSEELITAVLTLLRVHDPAAALALIRRLQKMPEPTSTLATRFLCVIGESTPTLPIGKDKVVDFLRLLSR